MAISIPNALRIQFLCLLAGVGGCKTPPPELPAEGTFEWATYTNDSLGFSLDYPGVYRIDVLDGGGFVRFKGTRGIPMKITWITPAEGRDQGLWANHTPVAKTELGGRSAQRYHYEHGDGPFYRDIVSFVVQHKGKELGLEFSASGELSALEKKIVDSFSWH